MGSRSGRCILSGLPILDGDTAVEIYAPFGGRLHQCRDDYGPGDIPMWGLAQAVERSHAVHNINEVLRERQYAQQFAHVFEQNPEAAELFNASHERSVSLLTLGELLQSSGVLYRVGTFVDGELEGTCPHDVWRRGFVHQGVFSWFKNHHLAEKDLLWAFERRFSDQQALDFLREFPSVVAYLEWMSHLRKFLWDVTYLGLRIHLSDREYAMTGCQLPDPMELGLRARYLDHLKRLNGIVRLEGES